MGLHQPIEGPASNVEPLGFEAPATGSLANRLGQSPLIVASQLGDGAHEVFSRTFPDIQFNRLRPGSLSEPLADADVLIAAPFRKAGGALPSAPPPGWPGRLKWVQLLPAALDLYPDWLFKGVTVTTAGAAPAFAMAEFALAAIYAEAKHLPEAWVDRIEAWTPAPVRMVAGSTLGIVGYGAVGRTLALQARGLGLNVLVHRRSRAPVTDQGIQRVRDLKSLFARADHVVLAAAATPETQRLVDEAVLAEAKPGLHLINLAFGGIIDDAALLRALESGRVGRATLDVAAAEPPLFNHPYYRHPQVRLSARAAINTPAIWRSLADQFAQNLIRYRCDMPLANVVKARRGY